MCVFLNVIPYIKYVEVNLFDLVVYFTCYSGIPLSILVYLTGEKICSLPARYTELAKGHKRKELNNLSCE